MHNELISSSGNVLTKNKIFWLSLIPLFIIILGEIFKIFLINEVQDIFYNDIEGLKSYIDKINLFQLFVIPLVGFLSDKYGRKRVLILALISLIISSIFLKSHSYVGIAAVFYALGAIIPVARAAYCDVHIFNKRTPNIVNTFLVQSIPWIFFTKPYFQNFYVFIGLIGVSVFALIMTFLFQDWQDKFSKTSHFKFEGIRNNFSILLRVIVAFVLSNTIWNLLHYYLEEKQPLIVVTQYFFLSQGLAYFFGVLIARFIDVDPKKILGLIFVFISVCLSLQIVEWAMGGYQGDVIPPVFVSFTFFGGLGIPLLYSLFGRHAAVHEQGILFGFLEACQVFTEWGGSASLNHIAFVQNPSGIVMVVLIGSFISLLLTAGLIRTRWRKSA